MAAKAPNKKTGHPRTSSLELAPLFSLPGRKEFGAFVAELTKINRSSKATLMEQALVHYAKHLGYTKPIPPRI